MEKEDQVTRLDLAIMRVRSGFPQRAFPRGQLRKTAAIDLRDRPAGVSPAGIWKERSRGALGFSRARS